MNKVTTVGIDLAKRVFALHGVEDSGRVVLRRLCKREELVRTVAQLLPCLIGMEACGGAHEWARRFACFGHTVRLMAKSRIYVRVLTLKPCNCLLNRRSPYTKQTLAV